MKVVGILLLVGVAGVLGAPNGGYGGSPSGYGSSSVLKAPVPILKYIKNDNNAGQYNLEVQSGDGSSQSESGQLKDLGGPDGPVQVKQGQYSFQSPEGNTYTVTYTADENGFQAKGAHLPTPPPIPPEILKSLQSQPQQAYGGYSSNNDYSSGGYSAPPPPPQVKFNGYQAPPPPQVKFNGYQAPPQFKSNPYG